MTQRLTSWASVASAAAWELAEELTAADVPDVWTQLERRATAELERGVRARAEFRKLMGEAPSAPLAAARGPAGQLDLFGAPPAPAGSVVPAMNPFEGPCVVCGEPGRRRLTFPAAFAAAMPPLEPTCVQHELVADWGVPLSADEASRVIRGELIRTPTFRYRNVYGSKAAKDAKKKVTEDG